MQPHGYAGGKGEHDDDKMMSGNHVGGKWQRNCTELNPMVYTKYQPIKMMVSGICSSGAEPSDAQPDKEDGGNAELATRMRILPTRNRGPATTKVKDRVFNKCFNHKVFVMRFNHG